MNDSDRAPPGDGDRVPSDDSSAAARELVFLCVRYREALDLAEARERDAIAAMQQAQHAQQTAEEAARQADTARMDAERRVQTAEQRAQDAERRVEEAEQRVEEAEQRRHDAEQRYVDITSSRTWRMTGPVRWMMDRFRPGTRRDAG